MYTGFCSVAQDDLELMILLWSIEFWDSKCVPDSLLLVIPRIVWSGLEKWLNS